MISALLALGLVLPTETATITPAGAALSAEGQGAALAWSLAQDLVRGLVRPTDAVATVLRLPEVERFQFLRAWEMARPPTLDALTIKAEVERSMARQLGAQAADPDPPPAEPRFGPDLLERPTRPRPEPDLGTPGPMKPSPVAAILLSVFLGFGSAHFVLGYPVAGTLLAVTQAGGLLTALLFQDEVRIAGVVGMGVSRTVDITTVLLREVIFPSPPAPRAPRPEGAAKVMVLPLVNLSW